MCVVQRDGVAKVTVLCVERGFIWKIMGVCVKKEWKLMESARSLLDVWILCNLQMEANCA